MAPSIAAKWWAKQAKFTDGISASIYFFVDVDIPSQVSNGKIIPRILSHINAIKIWAKIGQITFVISVYKSSNEGHIHPMVQIGYFNVQTEIIATNSPNPKAFHFSTAPTNYLFIFCEFIIPNYSSNLKKFFNLRISY
jgi:hypothetical protein